MTRQRPVLLLCHALFSGPAHSQQGRRGLATAAAVPTVKLVVTVLSWNVFGHTHRGMAGARKISVPRVIRRLDPDVALLQETRTGIVVERTIQAAGPGRLYKEVHADNKKESRILYDANIYTPVPLGGRLKREVQRLKLGRRISQVLRERTSIVGLRPAAARAGGRNRPPKLVFMSFHNVRSGEAATALCQLVAALGDDLGTLIVAGVDLNCHRGTFENRGVFIPPYKASKRRRRKSPIDFFVLSRHSVRTVVRAEGLLDAYHEESSKLHKVVRETVREMEMEDGTFTLKKFSLSLDHDPLVCELTVTVLDQCHHT